MLSRQRHCSRQLDFFAMLLRLHDNIDNSSDALDNRLPTISTIRDNTPICKVHVRIERDTAFTGCTVWPMKGKMMTKIQQRDATMARKAVALGMPDMAARTLSAAHRAAMRARDKREIETLARELGITGQRDWVICG
jgi:hypothetical protein